MPAPFARSPSFCSGRALSFPGVDNPANALQECNSNLPELLPADQRGASGTFGNFVFALAGPETTGRTATCESSESKLQVRVLSAGRACRPLSFPL